MNRNERSSLQNRFLSELEQARETLAKLPNVVAMGIGMKETAGKFTDEIVIRVFVEQKISRDLIAPQDLIPAEINGIKTDVLTPLVVTDDSDVCGDERRDLTKFRPIQAGIAISTDSTSYGTLGWFGTLDADDTPILLTNKHVLYDATNTTDNRHLKVAQPQLGSPSTCCCCECGSDNAIGESIIGIRDIAPASNTSVDCAIAKIDPAIAAEIIYEITNNATDEVLTVTGTGVAVVGDRVRKIGARSGFTTGTVVHLGDIAVAAPNDSAGTAIIVRQGQVLIIPVAEETYQVREGVCKFAFSNSGDSGAVILNDDDEIIALNWGGDRTTNNVGITLANNIANVLSKLSGAGFAITLSTSEDGGGDRGRGKSAKKLVQKLERTETKDLNYLEQLREANRESILYQLFDQHHEEVLHLVNTCRPVTIAWQRGQGPAYVAALARAAREERYQMPMEVAGINRTTLLQNMGEVLQKYGSSKLKEVLKLHQAGLIQALSRGEKLEQMAERLELAGFLECSSILVKS
jgi:hypothetical protein